jgi:cytolysin (calcineurin-like family phosphatase)
MSNERFPQPVSRRCVLAGLLGLGAVPAFPRLSVAQSRKASIDATFLFISDVHACRMAAGLSPNCAQEGKTDANLLRHIAAINDISNQRWPAKIGDAATGLASAGGRIAEPLGVIVGGDMTDDGGGQVAKPGEGSQLRQFSQRYQQGVGPDRVHFPVYTGLGNHDLDQDGLPPHVDWYRRELRDYVELNHRQSVFFKAPVPATNYDVASDAYSWDWGGLHLVQAHRFAGDTTKGASDSLPWLKDDLKTYAADGRPVVLFQHYGWDPFSTERWDPEKHSFDDEGTGSVHWWSDAERAALLLALKAYNVIGIFHGHQHETPMIYRREGLDMFKPKAAYMGGLAVVRVTDSRMDVVLGEAGGKGGVTFTDAFSKAIG